MTLLQISALIGVAVGGGAVVLAPMSLIGGLAFARMMERHL